MHKNNKQVVIIGDGSEVLISLQDLLSKSGFTISAAINGEEGVLMSSECNPELIICNVNLADMKGFELLKVLRSNPLIQNIPILFLNETTAFIHKEFKEFGLNNDDFIDLHYDPRSTIDKINRIILKYRSEEEQRRNTSEILDVLFSKSNEQKYFSEFSKFEKLRIFAQKEMIYEESDIPQLLYYVKSGGIKIYKTSSYGKELITQVISEGQFFGYRPLLLQTKYSNSAQALEKTSLLVVPKIAFTSLFKTSKIFTERFITMMSETAVNFEQELLEMAYSSVRRRVARALLTFVGDNNLNPRIHLSISRENLAAKAGTAKETLIRTLSEFKSEGIINTKGKTISILSLDGLRLIP